MIQSEFIYNEASYPSCHASTIAVSGSYLVASWFGGASEGSPDVCIWLARHSGGQWFEPFQAATGIQPDGTRYPCWNPVLFQPGRGPLLLFYKVGPNPRAWWGMYVQSHNHGATWTTPERLPDGILGPIKNKPVELPDGRILCPSSSEDDGWRVHFETTHDLGKTWLKTMPLNDGVSISAIQPSILIHSVKRLQAIGRTKQRRLFTTESRDGGASWDPLTLTDLPNPNSGTDAVTLRDGRSVLVYNRSETERTPLNVAISSDGSSWRDCCVLEDEPGEFSYPAIIQVPNGMIHVTYTWKRRRIRHLVLDPTVL